MKMCSRCKKNVAVVFVSKVEGDKTTSQGLCITCARELGLNQVDDIMQQMGLDPEESAGGIQEMIESLGLNPEDMGNNMEEVMEKLGLCEEDIQSELGETMKYLTDINSTNTNSDDNSLSTGSAAPIGSPLDFLNRVFSKSNQNEEFNQNKSTKESTNIDKKDKKKRKSLETFGVNLTEKASNGTIDRVIGRDKEIARVMQILNRRTKNNPVLLGEPGVGKTAIAEGLALRIVEKKVPAKLYSKEVYLLDFAALVAGTQFRGQFESRLKNLIEEVKSLGNIILVIDELHNIMGAGNAEGAMNAANILKPALARGELQIIGATTIDEYRKHIEKDSALERRFQPVSVDEPSVSDTIEIICGVKDYYENYHKVKISDEVITAAAILSERYIHDRFLPDKALDVIDEASSKVNLSNMGLVELVELNDKLSEICDEKEKAILSDSIEAYQKAADLKIEECRIQERIKNLEDSCCHVPITVEDIEYVIEQWTKIPVQKLSSVDSKRLLDLESILHKRVVGQNKAIDSVSRAIRRRRVGIMVGKRPISFIFIGPTGVGKTELVKALAESVYGSEEALIRLDMSEYMEKHSASKIIGSPPGYIGYDEAGQLTEKIRRNPYSIVLLDEIEKAHSDIFNILLQILDDGRITDSHGRVVNFENTIIVMTSNAGSELKTGLVGFESISGTLSKYDKMLKQIFRPEFLNRIDEIVEFTQLNNEELLSIVDLMLKDLRTGLTDKEITFDISNSAKELILEKGYKPEYGARPIRRVIMKYIEDKVADLLINGDIKNGNTFRVDADGKEFTFETI